MKVTKFSELFLLLLIIALSVFLRLDHLEQIPSGFYVDEAVIGYNAYSLLNTGKDEFGKAWPVFLRSYGAYASPLYTYLTVIPVYFFELSIFSTRFLSAFAGVLTTLLIYLILKRMGLFKWRFIPLLGSFLFAITPWTVFFSRGAFEANLAFLFICLSFYLFLLSEKNTRWLIPCALILAISSYTYQADRLAAYLLLGLFLHFRFNNKKSLLRQPDLIVSALLFLVSQIPQLVLLTKPAFTSRAGGLFYSGEIIAQANKLTGFLPYPVAWVLSFARQFLSEFSAYLSPRNLFWNPDSDLQRSLPGLSVFYPWMVLPYLTGMFLLLKNLKEKKQLILFLMLIIFALIPALTGDPFSSLRSLGLLLPMFIIILWGLDWFVSGRFRKWVFLLLPILIIWSGVLFWKSYYIYFPNERAVIWGYGFQQLADQIRFHSNEEFLIDAARSKPVYIEMAFFLKYSPDKLQSIVDPEIRTKYYENTQVNLDYEFANLRIGTINWQADIYKKQIMVGDRFAVSEGQAIEHELEKVFEIKDPLGEVVFEGWRTNPARKCLKTQNADAHCKVPSG